MEDFQRFVPLCALLCFFAGFGAARLIYKEEKDAERAEDSDYEEYCRLWDRCERNVI